MRYLLSFLSVASLALALTACGDNSEQKVEQDAETTMEATKQKLNDAADSAHDKLKSGAQEVDKAAQKAKDAAGEMKNKMMDDSTPTADQGDDS